MFCFQILAAKSKFFRVLNTLFITPGMYLAPPKQQWCTMMDKNHDFERIHLLVWRFFSMKGGWGAQVPGHVTAATNMKKSNHQESQCSMIIFLSYSHTHINTNWCYHRLEGEKIACRSLSAYPSVFSASSTPWDHPWLSGWWTYNKWSSWPLKSLFWPIIIFAQWCHASGVIKPTPHFISPSSFVTS